MQGYRVLVADDERKILKILKHSLTREGFEVTTAADGKEALEKVRRENFDIILLDVMMPYADGFDVAVEIRKQSSTPIMILSVRDDEVDRVLGFRIGVDDYVAKPFSVSEVVLRVKAILRRVERENFDHRRRSERYGRRDAIVVGDLEIRCRTREVLFRGRMVDLTCKEFEILRLLAGNPNRIFSRDEICDYIWDGAYEGNLDSITVLVGRLRKKIEDRPSAPAFIKTVWGLGYRFDGNVVQEFQVV